MLFTWSAKENGIDFSDYWPLLNYKLIDYWPGPVPNWHKTSWSSPWKVSTSPGRSPKSPKVCDLQETFRRLSGSEGRYKNWLCIVKIVFWSQWSFYYIFIPVFFHGDVHETSTGLSYGTSLKPNMGRSRDVLRTITKHILWIQLSNTFWKVSKNSIVTSNSEKYQWAVYWLKKWFKQEQGMMISEFDLRVRWGNPFSFSLNKKLTLARISPGSV